MSISIKVSFYLALCVLFSTIELSLFAADVGDYGQVTGLYDPNEILPVYLGNGIDIQDVAFCLDVNSNAPQVGDYYTVVDPITAIPNHNDISAVLNAVYAGYDLYPDVQQAIWYFTNPGYNPTVSGAQTIIDLVNNGTYQPITNVTWMYPDNTNRQPLIGVNRVACAFDLSNATLSPVNPTGCNPSYDGQFIINNLEPNETYAVTYIQNGVTIGPLNLTASAGGTIVIDGLSPDNYNTFEFTSTTESACFQCFSQANGYDLTYTETGSCPIIGPVATVQSQLGTPSSATSENCETVAATWDSPTNALANDGLVSSVTLSQALLGTRASHCLHVTDFGLNIPECAVINGVEIVVGGTSTSSATEDRIVRLVDGSGSYISSDQSIGSWPTSGTNTYGGTSDLWGAGSALTPTLLNSGGFGVSLKVGVPVQLFNNADITVGVDYVDMTVYYSLPEVCAGEQVVFSVTSSPNVVNYTWSSPTGTFIESGQGTESAIINMNNIAIGCYDICVDAQLECTGVETCCYTVNVIDCCPDITLVTDTGVDACYSGTPVEVTYTATTDYGTNGVEYTIIWSVDGIEQVGETGDQFVYAITPPNTCDVMTTPNVTAQLYCNDLSAATGSEVSSSSTGYAIYPVPVEGVDYTIINDVCSVGILDNCGTLEITNDQGTGSSYSINQGDPDQTVNFVISGSALAPVGCETTEALTVSCIFYDIALSKSVTTTVVSVGDDVIYTVTVYNEGTGELTGIVVGDTLATSLDYGGVYTASQGTFDGLNWMVGSLAPGDSAVLNFTTNVLDWGVIVNYAEVVTLNEMDFDSEVNNALILEDDAAQVCISSIVEVCTDEVVDVLITAEPGYTTYQWYLDGVLISGATSQTYTATTIGAYTYVVDENVAGSCMGELCCPVIINQVECCEPIECIPVTLTIKK